MNVIIATDSGTLVKMVEMANFVKYFTTIKIKKKKKRTMETRVETACAVTGSDQGRGGGERCSDEGS